MCVIAKFNSSRRHKEKKTQKHQRHHRHHQKALLHLIPAPDSFKGDKRKMALSLTESHHGGSSRSSRSAKRTATANIPTEKKSCDDEKKIVTPVQVEREKSPSNFEPVKKTTRTPRHL